MTPPPVSLKETVNLPQTDFPIRAGLATREPELLAYWAQMDLPGLLQKAQAQAAVSYMLHDGPPYPNGPLHMGHALNKILKDIIVRFHMMRGERARYIPGWDCHGLPIETQVLKSQSENESRGTPKPTDIPAFRQACKEFALHYVNIQRDGFRRLGVMGEWEKPYLTLDPEYEAEVIRLFGKMAENGVIYRGQKPIHWCTHCETALAEAEIEYAEHRSPSIYVTFPVSKASPELANLLKDKSASMLVWTTTPWTLPANVALAVHPELRYAVVQHEETLWVMAQDRREALQGELEMMLIDIGSVSGKDLLGTVATHPFLDRQSPVVPAAFVSAEDGTGIVHIAPGHGYDDYQVGIRHDLPVIMPVDARGRFTSEVPHWEGLPVFEANKPIVGRLEENGHLVKLRMIKHSYPHCWRCKNPVIFRATEQWFVAMDTPLTGQAQTLREIALREIDKTEWIPKWGYNRIRSMVENRPDWCISRQRYWGIPIPAFRCKTCRTEQLTGVFNAAAVALVKKSGSTAWFSQRTEDILPSGAVCPQCGGHAFEKETDILDVWFESGASFAGALGTRGEPIPTDLYLEGSDQHRGWFQSSLLMACAALGHAPYKAVLTHGFLVDESGKKMSKSMGNVVDPAAVIAQSGADILRWWAASMDFKGDLSISQNILKQATDSFSKVRNTLRFLLSNLYDFDFAQDGVQLDTLEPIDRWILAELAELAAQVVSGYGQYHIHAITHRIHNFCAVSLSALYLDIVKDRLYCDPPDGPRRRSTQTALYHLLDTLLPLLAPILVFTAEDAYRHWKRPDKAASIHLVSIASTPSEWTQEGLARIGIWEKILEIREAVYQVLEPLRADKTVKSFLEAKVVLTLPQDLVDLFAPVSPDWASILIVSQVEITSGSHLEIRAEKAVDDKCERCWKILPLHRGLCARCEAVVYPEVRL